MSKDFLKIGLERMLQDTSLGQECFDNIIKMLGELIGIDFGLIGILDEEKIGEIKTLSMLEHGKIVANRNFILEGSPCLAVTGRTMRVFEDNVADMFLSAEYLKKWHIRGYFGVQIFDMKNKPLGLIALMSQTKFDDSTEKRSLIQICASKVSSEIDRIKYEEKLKLVNLKLDKEVEEKTEELNKLTKTMSLSLIESEQKYRLLFENNRDALVNLMPEYSTHFNAANKAAIAMYGMSSEAELLQYGPGDLSPEFQLDGKRSSDKGVEVVTKASQEGSHVFEWRHKKKNGEEFDCLITLTSISTMGKNLIQASLRDITKSKKLEEDLQAALKIRDLFMGVASHELKTPLTTLQLQIHSLIRIMNDGSKPIPQEKVKAKLLVIKRQGERFEELVNSLLDISQINSGKLKLKVEKNLNLSDLGEEIIERFQDEFSLAESKLTAKIEPDILGNWDGQRVDQVISNLISNALKYGGGKPVEVYIRKKDNFALIEVIDKGIGIAEDSKDKIFERFERAVDEHSFKGLGLGLWIVAEILKSFDGKIWVESELGKGSRFTAQIPIEQG